MLNKLFLKFRIIRIKVPVPFILSKSKLSKKDKEIVFDLIKASLSDIDKDFGKVKNNEEIDKIINQLKQELENN